jgi:phosphoserine phosphatase
MNLSGRIEKRLIHKPIALTHWTARQFEGLVLAVNPKTAVFDCDGTLWSGDSGVGFMNWSIQQGLVSRSTSDWMDTRYRAYQAGKVSEVDICAEMVQIYAGLREQELRDASARFVRKFVPPRVFAEMAALVSALRQAGAEIWAVSSTNKWVIAEGVRCFGIPESRILAAEARVDQGLISSEILDVPTGQGKAAALARMGLVHPDVAFGNSIHDLAMLEAARHAFPVNPSLELAEAAAKNGWGCFLPQEAEGVQTAVPCESL